jgi:hypothetical protein
MPLVLLLLVNGARAGRREGKRPILARWEEVCGALPGTAAFLLAFSLQTIFPLRPSITQAVMKCKVGSVSYLE